MLIAKSYQFWEVQKENQKIKPTSHQKKRFNNPAKTWITKKIWETRRTKLPPKTNLYQ